MTMMITTTDSNLVVESLTVGGEGASYPAPAPRRIIPRVLQLARVLCGMGVLFFVGILSAASAEETRTAPAWPLQSKGLLFSFLTVDDIHAFGDDGLRIAGYRLTPRRFAWADHEYGLVVDGGEFEAEGVPPWLLRNWREQSAFTIEFCATSSRETQPSGATLIESGNFALTQVGRELIFLFKTSGPDSATHEIPLFPIEDRTPARVAVTYSNGEFHAYLNGAKIIDRSDLPRDLSGWESAPLIFGTGRKGDWSGRLEGVALYSRALDGTEILADVKAHLDAVSSRPAVPLLEVSAVLTAKSAVPSLEELSPYKESIAVYKYRVEKVTRGEYAGDVLYAAHWTVLDKQYRDVSQWALGQTHTLILEPFDSNSQIKGINVSASAVDDFALPWFFDVISDVRRPLAPQANGGPSAAETASSVEAATPPRMPPQPGEMEQRQAALESQLALLDAERARHGDWASWYGELQPFREALQEHLRASAAKSARTVEALDNFRFTAKEVQAYLRERWVPFPPAEPLDRDPLIEYIVDIDRQLKDRGIDLIFVPAPMKAAVHHEKLMSGELPVSPDPKMEFVLYELLRRGVEVVDLLPAFMEAKADGTKYLFHAGDMHWSSGGIQIAARRIADRLKRYRFVSDALSQPARYRSTVVDTYEEWTVILDASGAKTFEASENAPILVLGDSFARHESQTGGALPALIAEQVNTDISMFSMDGSGGKAFESAMQASRNFLDGRRVVIWIVSAQYLQWKDTWPASKLVLP